MSIVSRFKSKYGHLKKFGLEINGLAEIDYGINVISVSHPFIFDNRLLPKEFEGTTIRSSIHGELPGEFQIDQTTWDWSDREYIWAPERFEKFVDRSIDELREKLGNNRMIREEILDALCFGNFLEHKRMVEKSIEEGKIPPYQQEKDEE